MVSAQQHTLVDGAVMEDFVLGTPALVTRWRLHDRALPMEERHLRALGNRVVAGRRVTPQLVGWAKTHIEWSLRAGAAEHPCGVLMMIVDTQGHAAMSVGPYEELSATTARELANRAMLAAHEAQTTGVAPETLWTADGETCIVGAHPEAQWSASASLIIDLARTLGMPLRFDPGIVTEVQVGVTAGNEVFLVSDEHGIVPASDKSGPRGEMMRASYERLCAERSKR